MPLSSSQEMKNDCILDIIYPDFVGVKGLSREMCLSTVPNGVKQNPLHSLALPARKRFLFDFHSISALLHSSL